MKIILSKTKQEKKLGTKTVWKSVGVVIDEIDRRTYGLLSNEDTMKCFRRIGGSEYAEYGYTCYGYRLVRLVSTSPDKQIRTIREFEFKSN